MKPSFTSTATATVLALACFTATAAPVAEFNLHSTADIAAAFNDALHSVSTPLALPSYSDLGRAGLYDASTGLNFYYQLHNDPAAISGIERLTGSRLGKFVFNAFDSTTGFDQFKKNNPGFDITNPVSAIPEPKTYALLLIGLGLIAYAGRRRQTRTRLPFS